MALTFSTSFTGTSITFYVENLDKKVTAKNQVVPIRTVEQISGGTKTNIDSGFNPYYINLGYTESITISGYITDSTNISNIIDYAFPDVLLTVTSSSIAEFPTSSEWDIKSMTLIYEKGYSSVRKYSLSLIKQYNSSVR